MDNIKTYTVNQVAELLKTNPETVRRWIRTGKLGAAQSSKKTGNIITAAALTKFGQSMPKYAGALAGASLATASLSLPLALGGIGVVSLVNGLINLDNYKKTPIPIEDIEKFLKKEIKEKEKSLSSKKKMIKQLEKEISEYKSLLESSKLKLLADEINSKRAKRVNREVSDEK